MTPLEELQAAHHRLTELRDRQRVSPGAFHLVAEQGDEQHEVMTRWYANVVEKVEMLHRTIDVQLRMLSDVLQDWAAGYENVYVLDLARAINGGSDG